MLTWLKNFGYALLFDEAAAQRYLGVAAAFVGDILSSGGTIPGTATVLPGLEHFFVVGPYLKLFGLAVVAGGVNSPIRQATAATKEEKRERDEK